MASKIARRLRRRALQTTPPGIQKPWLNLRSMHILVTIIVAALALAAAWWLSGYDARVTGEDMVRDAVRRCLRILITILLAAFWFSGSIGPYGGAALMMIIPVSIALIWCGCLSEWWSHEFHRFLFAGGKGTHDPDYGHRELARAAALLRIGQHEEAVQLCEKLLESGDANVLVVETLLTRAGLDWKAARPGDPLMMAYRLRAEGNFAGAEKTVLEFLEQHPSNAQAHLLLIRLYAQDLKQMDQAEETLARFEKLPHAHAWQVDFARTSLHDWAQPKAHVPEPAAEPLPESIDELLARGFPGTAIERLEQKIHDQPGDFEAWLKLAEARGKHCRDLHSAEKIIRKIEGNPAFTPAQMELARAKLTEWRAAKPPAKI